MSYTISASLVSNTVYTAVYLNQMLDNLNALGIHNHSGSLGEGNTTILSGSGNISGSLSYRFEYAPRVRRGDWPGYSWTYYNQSSCLITYNETLPNQFYTFASGCLPRGSEWGWRDDVSNGCQVASGMGVTKQFHIQNGKYYLDTYYLTQANGGTITIKDVTGIVILELDTYGSNASILKASGSFYNSGSVPFLIGFFISSSKNVSSTGCAIALGAYAIQWSSS